MKPKLAAGVTCDFVNAAPEGAKFTTVMISPLFFLCSLLTSVPRQRESRPEVQTGSFGHKRLSSVR